MIMPDLYDVKLILPELTLAVLACVALIWGAYDKRRAYDMAAAIALGTFAVVAYLLGQTDIFLTGLQSPYSALAFGMLFRFDAFALIMKYLVLLGAAAGVLFGWRFFAKEEERRYEFFVLLMLSVLGMMVMISANNFLVLYVGLELQSLALYVLAAFQRDTARSTEAGLKYFVLGALSSGMLLFGISFIYGFGGTLEFTRLADVVRTTNMGDNLGLVTGLVFMLAGLAFKVSAVPFHMWTPDVYEGAPTPVTAFFAVAPKIAALALFVRLLSMPFGAHPEMWQQIVVFLAAASALIGSLGALRQTNLKRLMAYSSIGHMGFVLMGIAAASQEGIRAISAYMAIYLVMSVGAFACILAMRRGGKPVEMIADLKGLSKTDPVMALCWLAILFSLAGVPPLAGFFAKFYVVLAAVHSGLYALAVIGVLASVIAAFYYLNILKIIYFDEPDAALDRAAGAELRWIMIGAALILALFVVYPDTVMAASSRAATLIYSPE